MYKLLIVEDNLDLNEMFRIAFEDETDFVLESATSGIECLEKIKEFHPDVILLDIMLPFMDGHQIIETLRKNRSLKNTIIIANTNLEQKKEEEKTLRMGANFYLRKSEFTPSELVETVKCIMKGDTKSPYFLDQRLHQKRA